MKPFNLKEAKKKPHSVRYRNGETPVVIIQKPLNLLKDMVSQHTLISIDRFGTVLEHRASGEYFNVPLYSASLQSPRDLVLMTPPVKPKRNARK